MRHRAAYGLNLAIRAACAHAAAQGIDLRKADDFLRALAGRIPDGQLADYQRRIVKAAGLDLGDSPLDESELAAFHGDLAFASCFDALYAGGASVVPLRSRLGIVSQAATGDTAANGSTKTVSRFEFDGADVAPSTALALVVMTDEFFQIGLASGAETLEAELVKAAAVAADNVLVSALTASTPATAASTGNFAADLRAAFAGMPDNAGARYYALSAPRTVRQLSSIDNGEGVLLFPDIDAGRGGPAGGAARVLPCSALATAASTDPDLIVVDATTLALAASRMNVSLARHAALDMSDTPAGGAQNVVSLWATNSVAFRAERSLSATLLRDAGVFVVSGADYSEAA